MYPLLSIIIPTKNRYSYLESCLKSISFNYNIPDVEIIITDNSTVREDINAIALFSNLKYTYIDRPISQVENFEFALQMVTGEYVTMIGDDDSLSSLLLNVVNLLKSKNLDGLISPFVTYYWPDVKSKNLINNFSGKIFYKEYTYEFKSISVKGEIENCLKLGGGSLCKLPRMYYGLIKKEILDQVKISSLFYFPGPSPDMANAFSSALFFNNLIYFDAPLFIAGNSSESAAGKGLSGKHVGAIKGNPMLPSDCYLNWSNLIPMFWSGSTIWAESVLKAATLTGNEYVLKNFNYYRLYADCLSFHGEYSKHTYQAMDQFRRLYNPSFFFIRIKFEQCKVILLRFKFLISNIKKRLLFSEKFIYENIIDIQAASLTMKKFETDVKKSILNYNINENI